MMHTVQMEMPVTGIRSGARMLAVALACAAGPLFGDDAVSLKKSDADAWKDGSVTQPNMSSFLKNHDGYTKSGVDLSQYGWSDENDPDPSKDYVVNGSKTLFSPYVPVSVTKTELAGMCFTFPGKSLTLDNGTLGNRSCNDNGPAEVCVPNLIIKKGKLDNVSWSRKNRWGGTITVDSSTYHYPASALSFNINMNECFIDAKMVAAAPNQVSFTGAGLAPVSGLFRCVEKYRNYRFYLNGDCSEYCATNALSQGAILYAGTSLVGGSFDLGMLGTLSMTVASATLGGNVRGRDAALVVPENAVLKINGETDFAWAEPSAYTYSKSGLVSTNVYTLLPASEPYTPSHAVARNAACELNVIDVGSGSTLTLNDAKLSSTLLKLGAGATIAVEGTLTVDPQHPVEIALEEGFEGTVLSYPVAKGTLRLEDFALAEGSRGVFTVETVGSMQYLRGFCLGKSQLDAAHGYVTMTNADGNSVSTFKTASFGKKGEDNGFNGANNWSDGELPSAGKMYYTNGKYIRSNHNPVEFGGDRLAQDSTYRLAGGQTTTVSDWVLLANTNKKLDTSLPQITTSGGTGKTTVNGKATFFTTEVCPFSFYGSKTAMTWVLNLDFFGDGLAHVLFNGAFNHETDRADFHSTLEYNGDASGYRGLITLFTNLTCRISNGGFPNARFRQTDYTELETVLKNDVREIVLGEYLPSEGAVARPAAGTTLRAKKLSASGTLTLSGAGTFAAGGAAGSSGAMVDVTSGTLRADSDTAFDGVGLRFAAGTTLAVKYADDFVQAFPKGVEPASVSAPNGLMLAVDFDGMDVPDEVTVPVLTVDAATATALDGKVTVTGRPKAHSIKLVTGPVVDGKVTYSVEIARAGMILLFR